MLYQNTQKHNVYIYVEIMYIYMLKQDIWKNLNMSICKNKDSLQKEIEIHKRGQTIRHSLTSPNENIKKKQIQTAYEKKLKHTRGAGQGPTPPN